MRQVWETGYKPSYEISTSNMLSAC